MRRFRRFFAIVLSLSMVLTLFMPVSQTKAKEKKTDVGSIEEQADGQDAILEANAGLDEELSAQEEYTRVSAPKGINDDGSTADETVTGIKLDLKVKDDGLAEDDGRLQRAGNTGSWYCFYDNAILSLYNISVTYADGTTYADSLLNAVQNRKVTYATNQGYENPWKKDGTKNTLTITGGLVNAVVNVPVKKYFYEMFDGHPQLKEDAKTTISYLGSDANTGMCLFRAESDGTYYFYSSGATDTCARLYDEYGVPFAYDDDEYDDHNFLISAELEAGKTYVLETYVYVVNKNASYAVNVTKKDLGRPSLEGRDLSGKYINLALVVDTTGSMTGIINKVKNSLNQFVDIIAATNATLRISLIDYKDITSGNGADPAVLHYSPSLSIWFENDDVEALKEEIRKLNVDAGGDGPESAVDAMANLLEPDVMTFNMAAAKFAFLVTDATFKEENEHGLGTYNENGNLVKGSAMKQLIHRLVEKGVTTSVITTKTNYAAYEAYGNLTSLTDGIRINSEGDFTKAMSRIAAQIVDETEDWEADPDIVPVIGVELGEDLSVPEGKIKNFRPTFNPSNASEQGVVWKVEDETIAKVSPRTTNGILVVQGIKGGTTKIIARSLDGGYVASFDLTVQKTVVTDSKMESCDIDSILDELDKPEPTEGEKPITDLVYYGDAEPTVGEEKQKGIYSKIIRTPKSISYVFDDEIGDLLYQWKFEGEGITDSDIAVDLNVAVDAADSRVDQAAIDKAELDPYTVIDFSHDGELPGTATVTIKVGDQFEDGSYDLYYYNEATHELELCEDTEVTISGGLAVFSISHCSSYVIGKKHIPPTPTPTVAPTEAPTPTPTVKPTEVPTPIPTVKPTEVPTPVPTPVPTVKPTEVPTPIPTAEPTEVPTPTPTVKPTEVPTPTPTVEPTEVPTAKPTETPTGTATPTVAPTETPRPAPVVRIPAKGTQLTDKKALYKVTKAGRTGGTVTYTKPLNSKATVVSVPDTVTVGGITYKVTSIAPNAFKKCKNLKKITIGKNITKIGAKAFYKCSKLAKILIKTKKLTMKKVGSKAFRDIYKRVSVNVPKARLKAYKKLLMAKGCNRKAKIK